MKNVGPLSHVPSRVSDPLVRPETLAPVTGVETQPVGTGSATQEHRTLLGEVASQRPADALLAKGLVESVAFALSGSTRDIEAYVKAPTIERLEKVNRGLAHLLKEAEATRASPDVQLTRTNGDLGPSLDRVERGFTNLLAAFGKLDDVTLRTSPAGLASVVHELLGGPAELPPLQTVLGTMQTIVDDARASIRAHPADGKSLANQVLREYLGQGHGGLKMLNELHNELSGKEEGADKSLGDAILLAMYAAGNDYYVMLGRHQQGLI